MTRNEAIQQIKWYFECDDGIAADNATKEAVDMAIEALQREEAEANGYCHRIKPKGGDDE